MNSAISACATQPQAPAPAPQAAEKPIGTGASPAEAAPERKPGLPPVDLTPVPFEVARANFVRDTAQRYGIPAAQIEARGRVLGGGRRVEILGACEAGQGRRQCGQRTGLQQAAPAVIEMHRCSGP